MQSSSVSLSTLARAQIFAFFVKEMSVVYRGPVLAPWGCDFHFVGKSMISWSTLNFLLCRCICTVWKYVLFDWLYKSKSRFAT